MGKKTLYRHKVDFGKHQEKLEVLVEGNPGPGGAHHHYAIVGFDTETNPDNQSSDGYVSSFSRLPVIFQHGTVPECGSNGVTIEALLAICEHRLLGFQSGPFKSTYNAEALEHIGKALDALKQRTLDRLIRDVEGLNKA